MSCHPFKQQKPHAPRGITLVEMLVAMAITLLMMATVATVFSQIGTAVNDTRSTLEMSARLRNARTRLHRDLAGHTCPGLPWRRPEAGEGYIEYLERPHRDMWMDNNLNQIPDDFTTSTQLRVYPDEPTSLVDRSALGDFDDILMLTVRSRDEPFVSRREGIQSHVAEVVWFAVEDHDGTVTGRPGMRTIYRRVLLVAPWVADSNLIASSEYSLNTNSLLEFQERYDLSAHLEGNRIVLNSLADLTKREYRFLHTPAYPHLVPNGGVGYTSAPTVSVTATTGSGADLQAVMAENVMAGKDFVRSVTVNNGGSGYPPDARIVFSGGGGTGAVGLAEVGAGGVIKRVHVGPPQLRGDRTGEDLMLDNVLAWDIRIYDPTAPILSIGSPPNVDTVTPGDPGWYTEFPAASPTSQGAFVDLGYLNQPWNPTARISQFATLAHPKALPSGGAFNALFALTNGAYYDTWSFHYEIDGVDQDNRDGDDDPLTGADEGTDGFDDDSDANAAVDDMGERETSPPYPLPLRGLQLRMRVYEPSSRQIREVAVQQAFATP